MVTRDNGDKDLEDLTQVSPLSANNNDTKVVDTGVVDHHRNAIVRYENSFRRFQAVRDQFGGRFGDRQIEEAVTYIHGNPRSDVMSSVTPQKHLGKRDIEMTVENAVIDALEGLHQHGHEYNVNNFNVAAAALDVLPEAAHKLNPANLRDYVLVGLRFKEMSEVFDAGALTHLPVPQSDNAPAGWIPETYFSDSEISTFFLSALQAKQQDPAWYSDMSLKIASSIEAVGTSIGQYKQRVSDWFGDRSNSKTKDDKFSARSNETRLDRYVRRGVIAAFATATVASITTAGVIAYHVSPTARGAMNRTGAAISLAGNLAYDTVTGASGESTVDYSVAMGNAIRGNPEGSPEQTQAVWDVINDATCQKSPITIAAGSSAQAAKDVCQNPYVNSEVNFGKYSVCEDVVKTGLMAAAGNSPKIDGRFDLECDKDKYDAGRNKNE